MEYSDAAVRFAAYLEACVPATSCTYSIENIHHALKNAFAPPNQFGNAPFGADLEGTTLHLDDLIEGQDQEEEERKLVQLLEYLESSQIAVFVGGEIADIKERFPTFWDCQNNDIILHRLFDRVLRTSGYSSLPPTLENLLEVQNRDWSWRNITIIIVSCVAFVILGLSIFALAGVISTADRHAAAKISRTSI